MSIFHLVQMDAKVIKMLFTDSKSACFYVISPQQLRVFNCFTPKVLSANSIFRKNMLFTDSTVVDILFHHSKSLPHRPVNPTSEQKCHILLESIKGGFCPKVG